MPRFKGRVLAVLAGAAMLVGLSLAGSAVALGSGQPQASGVAPNAVNELDCNGFSTVYKSVKPDLGGLCTDPLTPPGTWSTQAGRFYDNGHYIGHDEPSVKFISTTPGSANNITYYMQLSTDPSAHPTDNPGPNNTTDYAELSPAPWFGLPICDPDSYPLNPCTQQSDSNSGEISNPADAGSAFMELQFYPPGYTPFVDAPSCFAGKWCAALTIDSLEAGFNFAGINPACEEPVNFAFLQTNGVPAGPPSPQQADVKTFTPNANTLTLNPGDTLKVVMHDISVGSGSDGLAMETTVDDLTTHQSGYMIASAANGFMNTNVSDCSGNPYNFAAEYSSASQANQVPWAALEGGVLMEDEMGHFEVCSSVSNHFPYSATYADGSTFSDPSVYQVCNGGSEGTGNRSQEQGCGPTTVTDGVPSDSCPGATTEDGLACPAPAGSSEPDSYQGLNCEYSDALCMPAGVRTITTTPPTPTSTTTKTEVDWPVAGCQDDYFQNGDLDFDGTSYQPDWPDGQSTHPTSFEYLGPFFNASSNSTGSSYPDVQIETDILASEGFCDVSNGLGCSVPPVGANFYAFWTLGRGNLLGSLDASDQAAIGGRGEACVWNFGNVIPGTTVNNLGMDSEYGTADLLRYGGTAISPVMANPQLARGCGVGGQG
jgi:hypothetical protein